MSTNIEEDEIWRLKLPIRPGSDLSSKMLLREDYIKNIIISRVVKEVIAGDTYYVGPNEQIDKKMTDVVYLPYNKKSREFPPIIVEIQGKVDHLFMHRIMRYSLNLFEETKVLPIVVVINVNGFSSRNFKNNTFDKNANHPYYTHPCDLWADKIFIYNADSIAQFIENSPLDPMIALVYFITQQERSILALDKFDDQTINKIYNIAYNIYSLNDSIVNDNAKEMDAFCDSTICQYNKILKYVKSDNENSRKRVIKYAEDGINYTNNMKKRCKVNNKSLEVTPIETYIKSADLVYVENHINNNSGRMNWEACYVDGIKKELFGRYSSHLTLKMAYHRKTL